MPNKIDQVIAHKCNEIKALPYARSIVSEDVIERNFGYKIIRHQVAAGKRSTIFKSESIKHAGSYCLVKPYKMGRDKIKQSLREDTCQIMRFVSGKCAQLISTYDIFYTNEKIYLMCDWSEKGEILSAMRHSSIKLNEEMLRNWTLDILAAIQFLHNNAICHRNVAPSCLLLTSENRCKIGSLSDAAIYCKPDGSLIKFKWTNFSRRNNWNQGPEVATRKPYDGRRADMWSLGATIFWFIVRAYPINYFKGNKPKQLEDRLSSMRKVTHRCQKFVRALLVMDPAQRPTPAAAMELEWITMSPSGAKGATPRTPERSTELTNEKTETGEATGPDETATTAPASPAEADTPETPEKKEEPSVSKSAPKSGNNEGNDGAAAE